MIWWLKLRLLCRELSRETESFSMFSYFWCCIESFLHRDAFSIVIGHISTFYPVFKSIFFGSVWIKLIRLIWIEPSPNVHESILHFRENSVDKNVQIQASWGINARKPTGTIISAPKLALNRRHMQWEASGFCCSVHREKEQKKNYQFPPRNVRISATVYLTNALANGHAFWFHYLLLLLLQEPWLCALSSALVSLFDSGQNPVPLFSQNLKFVSLIGFTLPCNLLLPLPKVIPCFVFNCHMHRFPEPWIVFKWGNCERERILESPFYLFILFDLRNCGLYHRWTWNC